MRCKNGRHFQELICRDKTNKCVSILLPVSEECEQEVCDFCSKKEACEISGPLVEVELGKKVVIRREES